MRWYTCPECGKKFINNLPTISVYRYKGKLYCSYTCWRTAIKKIEKPSEK